MVGGHGTEPTLRRHGQASWLPGLLEHGGKGGHCLGSETLCVSSVPGAVVKSQASSQNGSRGFAAKAEVIYRV